MKEIKYDLDKDIDKKYFINYVLNELSQNKKLVIACVGTDKSILDSFGPFVGTFLNELNIKDLIIYGNLDNPIHALNVNKEAEKIMKKHKDDFVIAIDACLSEEIGKTFYYNRPVKPGKGVGKNLEEIGHVSIKFISGYIGASFSDTHSYRISETYNAAKKTAFLIKELCEEFYKERELLYEISSDLF